jgi:hypothetical protein
MCASARTSAALAALTASEVDRYPTGLSARVSPRSQPAANRPGCSENRTIVATYRRISPRIATTASRNQSGPSMLATTAW